MLGGLTQNKTIPQGKNGLSHVWDRFRFFRFLFVGVLNTAIGYLLFLLISLAGLAYPITILISTTLGVLVNFATTGRLVFANKDNRRLFRFTIVYCINYLVNIGATSALNRVVDNIYLVQAVLAFPLAMMTFLLQKKFVFLTKEAERIKAKSL